MLLRSGKRTRKEIPIILPIEIQKKIFSQIDLYLVALGDRCLQKYLVNNSLLNDPEAVLCWAIGRRDRWLIKQILKKGYVPGIYARESAVLNNVKLDNLLIPIDTDSTRRFYWKHYVERGEISKALEYYDSGMISAKDELNYGIHDAIRIEDPGILRAIEIWPDLLHPALSYSCMNGKASIIRELHEHNMLQYYFNSEYFVHWAIRGNHAETVKYLIEIGFPFTIYDHKELGSIFQNRSYEMLEMVFDRVTIPDIHLEQGIIAAAEGGKLPIIQYLTGKGVNCKEPGAVYRSVTRGHIDTYYYLSGL